jgi:hypothetical protein
METGGNGAPQRFIQVQICLIGIVQYSAQNGSGMTTNTVLFNVVVDPEHVYAVLSSQVSVQDIRYLFVMIGKCSIMSINWLVIEHPISNFHD